MPAPCRLLLALALLAGAPFAAAQPTYKLEVKPDQKPAATLAWRAGKFARSDVADDPGFRLQLHFRKGGKTAAVVEARAHKQVAPPALAPGDYTVVLELFYPNYKGGTGPKGVYKPVSNVLAFRVEAGKPPRITPLGPAKKDGPAPKR
jgi:hypothetical protein